MTNPPTRTYGCPQCGHRFRVSPPDDIHTVAKLSRCEQGDSIETRYECKDCHKGNKIFWDITHSFIEPIHSRSQYADLVLNRSQ